MATFEDRKKSTTFATIISIISNLSQILQGSFKSLEQDYMSGLFGHGIISAWMQVDNHQKYIYHNMLIDEPKGQLGGIGDKLVKGPHPKVTDTNFYFPILYASHKGPLPVSH